MSVTREHIPANPEQSFRFFSWTEGLDHVLLHLGEEVIEVQGRGNEWHYHPEIEITLFQEGKGLRYVGDDVSSFLGGNLVLLGSNLPHHWNVGKSSGFCIQFLLGPSSPLSGLLEMSGLKDLVERSNKGLLFSQCCYQDVETLMRECWECDALERLSLFVRILCRLKKARAQTISSITPQKLASHKSATIQKAVRFIIDNATDESLSLQQVLDHICLNRATFSRHFYQALGQSYTSFVQSIRLEKARNLLFSTDQQITEIAYEVGFSNLSHFNNLFKGRWGSSPSVLRKTYYSGKSTLKKARGDMESGIRTL